MYVCALMVERLDGHMEKGLSKDKPSYLKCQWMMIIQIKLLKG
jgi:hypothetical protein